MLQLKNSKKCQNLFIEYLRTIDENKITRTMILDEVRKIVQNN